MKPPKLPYYIVFFVVLVMIGFFGGGMGVHGASAEKIIAISTLEYPPWTGKHLKFNGFVNQVITEAFQRKGYRVEYTYLPWKRALVETKNGKYLALSYVYFSKDREKDYYLSDPISLEKIVLFHLKANPIKDWNTLHDLKNYKFGATRGYTYTNEFWKAAKSKRIKVNVTNTDTQNFKKLLAGRIDIFPSGLVNGKNILHKKFDVKKSNAVSFHPKPLSQTTGHLAFTRSRKTSEKILRIFNLGLSELKEKGIYKQYMDNLLGGKYGQ